MLPAYAKQFPKHFPHLGTQFRKKSCWTIDYNCIAWAIGDIRRPWWPNAAPEYYWPLDVTNEETVDAFIEAFSKYGGYEVCIGAHHEWRYEKIALYVDADGTPTHAARQNYRGVWHSKIGYNVDLFHDTLSHLEGGLYGTAFCTMKRRWTAKRVLEACRLRFKTSHSKLVRLVF